MTSNFEFQGSRLIRECPGLIGIGGATVRASSLLSGLVLVTKGLRGMVAVGADLR
jgi:hypothetical protein